MKLNDDWLLTNFDLDYGVPKDDQPAARPTKPPNLQKLVRCTKGPPTAQLRKAEQNVAREAADKQTEQEFLDLLQALDIRYQEARWRGIVSRKLPNYIEQRDKFLRVKVDEVKREIKMHWEKEKEKSCCV
jgi:hypothetical protein